VILWELLSGKIPYHEEQLSGVTLGIAVLKGLRPPIALKWSTTAAKPLVVLMERCWAQKSADRPEMSVVVQTLEKMDVPPSLAFLPPPPKQL